MKNYELNPPTIHAVAKEITIKAIENNLIKPSQDAKETAERVLAFYQTLTEHIND